MLERKTRGRTARGRLRALDAYLVRYEGALLGRRGGAWEEAAFVDVGFGEQPWTTLESAEAFRAVHPGLRVVGVEWEAHRAEAAQAYAEERTDFRQGGFALPLRSGETVRLVRVMNLLRGYRPEQVPEVHQQLGGYLLEGGLLVEGSTDTPGGVLVAWLLRRGREGLVREGLLFFTDFSHGFAPVLFRDWLPRDLRRRVRPGAPIHAFFSAWTEAWQEARAEGHTEPQAAFAASVPRLASRWPGVAEDAWLRENGYLLLSPPPAP